MKIEEIENGIQVTINQKENYTLEDLKQNLINFLNENFGRLEMFEQEVELMKAILDNRKTSTSVNMTENGLELVAKKED